MSTTKKSIAALVAAVLVLSGIAAASGAFGAFGGGDESGQDTAQEAPDAQAPDVEGLPDVVAVVNDDEIARDDFVLAYENQFAQQSLQAQAEGQPIDQDALKQQTADGLVNNLLLIQEAQRRGFEATDEQVDESLETFAEQSGAGSSDAYLETLAEQGLDEDEVRSQLADQVLLDQLFADEGADEEPSEEELRELYDSVTEGQAGAEGQELPPFDELRDQLAEQVSSQRESEIAQSLIQQLREDAQIQVNL
ncbi:hypothetical protein GCM10009821_24610 [Aeromicrobium halocynthiae]|uniref:Peptidylprolyl isomerase n=1 Tax=Aeromicrobium halocynthiae TaxID=560557 RepID=A0ABN2W5U9_9ACTN